MQKARCRVIDQSYNNHSFSKKVCFLNQKVELQSTFTIVLDFIIAHIFTFIELFIFSYNFQLLFIVLLFQPAVLTLVFFVGQV